jgi:phosphoenolpyruvate carboxykinase (ATP)
MTESLIKTMTIKSWLSNLNFTSPDFSYQSDRQFLTDETIRLNRGKLTANDVLCINTGNFTGRSPEDRFIVEDTKTSDKVWWSNINKPYDNQDFKNLKKKLIKYFDDKHFYVRDAIAGSDPRHQLGLRIINEFPEHNLFAMNMFIDLQKAGYNVNSFEPDWTILHAPNFKANPSVDNTRAENFAIICFSDKTIIIGGTGYTGEIKKGVFSVLNFILPTEQNTLPMHCSANIGKDGDTTLFFGLSGTGKTTLSTDPSRNLIGDDEHGWTNDGSVFNFEGGCYAKVINLSEDKEPDIYRAIRPGALLENVILDIKMNPEYENSSITSNTRVSYPLNHIENLASKLGSSPKNIFFLTCDAYGVLPPISKLDPNQAAYHFISGYTAKVAGTEVGINEPKAVFSACFGAPFMPLHPAKYGEQLKSKMRNNKINVWLINTGWIGGSYGTGSRISLSYTRKMINEALTASFKDSDFIEDKIFRLNRLKHIEGIPKEVLDPRKSWRDANKFDEAAKKLALKFQNNFKQFQSESSPETILGGPSFY